LTVKIVKTVSYIAFDLRGDFLLSALSGKRPSDPFHFPALYGLPPSAQRAAGNSEGLFQSPATHSGVVKPRQEHLEGNVFTQPGYLLQHRHSEENGNLFGTLGVNRQNNIRRAFDGR
jgi:hypothetical protein